MPSGDFCTCHHHPSGERRPAPQPNRSPCCCEEHCTCAHYYGSGFMPPPPPVFEHNNNQRTRRSGNPYSSQLKHADVTAHADPHASRRCPVCIPEQAKLQDADLFALQQRCEEARLADQRRRSLLADLFGQRGHRGGGRNSYQSNTAEMLRRQRNSFYQKAVDAEYLARRRLLQSELDARRDELAEIQRAREAKRMEVAYNDAREARRSSSGPRFRSLQRPHSADLAARARFSTPPRVFQDQSSLLEDHSKRSDLAPSSATQPAAEGLPHEEQVDTSSAPPPQMRPSRKTSPPQQHCAMVGSHGPAAWATCCADTPKTSAPGQWHCGWIWCPNSACRGRHSPSPPRQQARIRPPSPECHVPASPCDTKPASGQASPTTREDLACDKAKRRITDTASRKTADEPGKSLSCQERDAAAGDMAKRQQPSSLFSAQDADTGGAHRQGRRGRGERGRGEPSRFRSQSASAVHLVAPRFGRKVFITDDVYCARRSRYMADWEACGAIQRMPTPSRSPSAPLPEKTPKWRTTGVDACCA
ncbi:hypothetical protein JKF63_02395 [Porcisia hertigi]|uniref:Uncharacterized protein n=1 Tax=Porcisia hertigi TaxID=2761500 RepID=A0A836HN06_9TRYP|nr:hypothetical protein JKF63_02395 [Porcisia hertigi]